MNWLASGFFRLACLKYLSNLLAVSMINGSSSVPLPAMTPAFAVCSASLRAVTSSLTSCEVALSLSLTAFAASIAVFKAVAKSV